MKRFIPKDALMSSRSSPVNGSANLIGTWGCKVRVIQASLRLIAGYGKGRNGA